MSFNIPYSSTALLPELAASNFTNRSSSSATYDRVTSIDGSSGLVTALSLTGRFSVSYLSFVNVTNEAVTVKLTIDGSTVFNGSQTVSANVFAVIGGDASGALPTDSSYLVRTSLLLEISTATDTDVILNYTARPIL